MNEKAVHYITSKDLPDQVDGEEIQAVCLSKERTELPYNVYVIREDLEEEFLELAGEKGKPVLKLTESNFNYSIDLEVGMFTLSLKST